MVGEIDEWLVEAIYSSPGFDSFFNKKREREAGRHISDIHDSSSNVGASNEAT